jgi:hypothetical protein
LFHWWFSTNWNGVGNIVVLTWMYWLVWPEFESLDE